MKLLNSFFYIEDDTESDAIFCYTIRFDSNHIIYKAHFPEKPITPGVCILQIARELLEKYLRCKLYLKKAQNVKYLAVLSPNENSKVLFIFSRLVKDKNECKVHVMVENNEHCSFAKLSLTFSYERI